MTGLPSSQFDTGKLGASQDLVDLFVPSLSRVGYRLLEQMTKHEILQRVEELRARGLGAVTINTYLRSVKAFCHWLFNEGQPMPNILERANSPLSTLRCNEAAGHAVTQPLWPVSILS